MEETKYLIQEMLTEMDETDENFIKTIQAMIRHYLEKKRRH
ncbi:hypothetical protein R2R35_13975 [Anaerocolumna sp. AGMB13020]|nr:hypothetical protein [Anaerocolumna sp. AGMB13020]WOO34906.1 hypothetical protein R2R35_13975 [Anaerocolumna sp. AGMB13020]